MRRISHFPTGCSSGFSLIYPLETDTVTQTDMVTDNLICHQVGGRMLGPTDKMLPSAAHHTPGSEVDGRKVGPTERSCDPSPRASRPAGRSCACASASHPSFLQGLSGHWPISPEPRLPALLPTLSWTARGIALWWAQRAPARPRFTVVLLSSGLISIFQQSPDG